MKVQSIRSLVLILGMGVLGTVLEASAVWGQQAPAPVPTVGESFMAHDYTRTNSFPNIFDSFTSLSVPQPSMQNSPRLKDLIRDGKLWLSLQDAIALALENNLDIDYVRFNIPLAQTDYLRTKAGSAARGTQGASISTALFSGAIGSTFERQRERLKQRCRRCRLWQRWPD